MVDFIDYMTNLNTREKILVLSAFFPPLYDVIHHSHLSKVEHWYNQYPYVEYSISTTATKLLILLTHTMRQTSDTRCKFNMEAKVLVFTSVLNNGYWVMFLLLFNLCGSKHQLSVTLMPLPLLVLVYLEMILVVC